MSKLFFKHCTNDAKDVFRRMSVLCGEGKCEEALHWYGQYLGDADYEFINLDHIVSVSYEEMTWGYDAEGESHEFNLYKVATSDGKEHFGIILDCYLYEEMQNKNNYMEFAVAPGRR